MFSVYGYNKMALIWGMESNKNTLELARTYSSSFFSLEKKFLLRNCIYFDKVSLENFPGPLRQNLYLRKIGVDRWLEH